LFKNGELIKYDCNWPWWVRWSLRGLRSVKPTLSRTTQRFTISIHRNKWGMTLPPEGLPRGGYDHTPAVGYWQAYYFMLTANLFLHFTILLLH
jgi:hypothetical protein